MNHKTCPWCGSEDSHIHLWIRDEFLSHEEFQIHECPKCGLLFTEPRPSKEKIGEYYKSEEYYSHQENKHGFIPKIYEKVKSVNLKKKYRISTKGMKTGKVLDIGCGVGDFLHTMEQKGWECTGVEPSKDAKNIARKRIKGKLFAPEEVIKMQEASFDLITMWHVLEHVDDLKWELEQLTRLIKPDGRIVIAVPNYKSYDAQFYKELWAAYDVPRHLNHFNQKTLANIFKTKGLNLVQTDKLIWDAYYISYMSEQYKHHSLPLLRGVFRGWISNCKARKSWEWSSMVYVFEREKGQIEK